MAKKNYVKIEYILEYNIRQINSEYSEIVFTGRNGKQTECEVKIKIGNWSFRHIARKMKQILDDHLKEAINRKQAFINELKELQ